MYLNKVFILGNLTADPQLRSTTNGIPVASFSVATNRVFKDKDGVTRTDVQYHNVVTWGRTAEIVNQFLKKGSMVLIEGRLQTRKFQDQQGNNRWRTEIICERLQLGPKIVQSLKSEAQNLDSSSSKLETENLESGSEKELPEVELKEEEISEEDLPF